ncbi:hypothetical protein VTN96DRAFT_4584 [Rasamsonia emersonii]
MTGPTTTSPIQLPIIDISNPDDPVVGKAMLDAAIKYGFFYVDGRGSDFSAEEVERIFELSKKFFASPREEKASCTIRTDNRGWSGMHTETLDPEHQRIGDFKEAMNFGEFKNGKAQQPLPPSLIPHEAELDHFATSCNRTCARVMKLLALGLEIPPDFFVTRHDPSTGPTGSILRLLYYPSLRSPAASANYRPDVDVRAGAHSDYGTITLLFQRPGQPGLEILTPEGTWASVPVWPDSHHSNKQTQEEGGATFPPIVVNIGDLLSFWTNGLLKSTVHRVVFPLSQGEGDDSAAATQEDRYSVVYFCHPVGSTALVPLPSPLVERAARERQQEEAAEAAKVGFGGGAGSLGEKRTLTAKEYLDQRLQATYGHREKA